MQIHEIIQLIHTFHHLVEPYIFQAKIKQFI